MKVAFFDRDGTVIKDYEDYEWKNVKQPEFLDEAIDSMKEICVLGYKIIFISNQYLINDGIISEDQFLSVNELFLSVLEKNNIMVQAFYYCPHSEVDVCNCKKPRPGMILKALEEYPEIDLNTSFYVGDSEADLGIARYFGLKTFYLGTVKDGADLKQIHLINNLKEMVAHLKTLN